MLEIMQARNRRIPVGDSSLVPQIAKFHSKPIFPLVTYVLEQANLGDLEENVVDAQKQDDTSYMYV